MHRRRRQLGSSSGGGGKGRACTALGERARRGEAFLHVVAVVVAVVVGEGSGLRSLVLLAIGPARRSGFGAGREVGLRIGLEILVLLRALLFQGVGAYGALALGGCSYVGGLVAGDREAWNGPQNVVLILEQQLCHEEDGKMQCLSSYLRAAATRACHSISAPLRSAGAKFSLLFYCQNFIVDKFFVS
jgi:hypothetical protein